MFLGTHCNAATRAGRFARDEGEDMGEGIERGIDVLSQTSPEHSPALRLRAVVADELAGPFVFLCRR